MHVQVFQVVMNTISYNGGTWVPQSLSCGLSTSEVWEERLPLKTEAKKLSLHILFIHLLLPNNVYLFLSRPEYYFPCIESPNSGAS